MPAPVPPGGTAVLSEISFSAMSGEELLTQAIPAPWPNAWFWRTLLARIVGEDWAQKMPLPVLAAPPEMVNPSRIAALVSPWAKVTALVPEARLLMVVTSAP